MNKYMNLRVAFNRTSKTYQLVEAVYDVREGKNPDEETVVKVEAVNPTFNLGASVEEVIENLESLVSDMENWEDEQLELRLN